MPKAATYAIRPDVVGQSELATAYVEHQRDVADRSIAVFGIAVHCTGSGIVAKALAQEADPFEYALAYYLRPNTYFAHYLIDFDGTIAQIAESSGRLACHEGISPLTRTSKGQGWDPGVVRAAPWFDRDTFVERIVTA